MSQIPHSWAGTVLRSAWHDSGLSLRQLARQAKTSHATLNAYITGSKSPSTATLERVIAACGYSLDVSLRPRVRFSNGVPRGEELAAILALTEQLQVRHSKELDAPIFAERIRSSA